MVAQPPRQPLHNCRKGSTRARHLRVSATAAPTATATNNKLPCGTSQYRGWPQRVWQGCQQQAASRVRGQTLAPGCKVRIERHAGQRGMHCCSALGLGLPKYSEWGWGWGGMPRGAASRGGTPQGQGCAVRCLSPGVLAVMMLWRRSGSGGQTCPTGLPYRLIQGAKGLLGGGGWPASRKCDPFPSLGPYRGRGQRSRGRCIQHAHGRQDGLEAGHNAQKGTST